MQVGVRHGCVLSPYLYALFTCLVFDEIAQRTSLAWATAFLTLFADSHLAWEISSVEDLHFFLHCLQTTFRVFQDFGMSVNPSKSQLVVKLRGNAARRWLRRHQHRTPQGLFLEVGTPHLPIRIPLVRRMQYLGIIASYDGFELQTCLHRQRAALANKHRLARVMHYRQLSLSQRVRVYVACVRSSLLYGQHATVVTPAVLRKLEQFDARSLRAIGKSPSHVTHESGVALRSRLRVDPPHM